MSTTYPATYRDLPRVAPLIEPATACAIPHCTGRGSYFMRLNPSPSASLDSSVNPIVPVCQVCAERITTHPNNTTP